MVVVCCEMSLLWFFFFFSSRRRHTRCSRDWSSDVCSSDLVDLLYIVMDNQIYGLTTGQTSPTSRIGMKTKSMPFGNIEAPVNPISLALAAGATFVARGFSGDQKHLDRKSVV